MVTDWDYKTLLTNVRQDPKVRYSQPNKSKALPELFADD